MRPVPRRMLVAATAFLLVLMMPASAAADCNGPDCGPPAIVEGPAILVTVAIVLVFIAILAAAELRRR